jgi:hypothetical protein
MTWRLRCSGSRGLGKLPLNYVCRSSPQTTSD